MMNKFELIDQSRKLLGIQEPVTIDGIKKNYRMLLHKWHPDKCKENIDKCIEMTKNLIKAYHTIIDYCKNYKTCYCLDFFQRSDCFSHF